MLELVGTHARDEPTSRDTANAAPCHCLRHFSMLHSVSFPKCSELASTQSDSLSSSSSEEPRILSSFYQCPLPWKRNAHWNEHDFSRSAFTHGRKQTWKSPSLSHYLSINTTDIYYLYCYRCFVSTPRISWFDESAFCRILGRSFSHFCHRM